MHLFRSTESLKTALKTARRQALQGEGLVASAQRCGGFRKAHDEVSKLLVSHVERGHHEAVLEEHRSIKGMKGLDMTHLLMVCCMQNLDEFGEILGKINGIQWQMRMAKAPLGLFGSTPPGDSLLALEGRQGLWISHDTCSPLRDSVAPPRRRHTPQAPNPTEKLHLELNIPKIIFKSFFFF